MAANESDSIGPDSVGSDFIGKTDSGGGAKERENFPVPTTLLTKLYGSRIVLVISGLLVGLLLSLPVELRLFSGIGRSVIDELAMSAFALLMAMLIGALGGIFQPCRFAEWGWITDLQMVERPASEMLRAIRRASYRWMLPHLGAVIAVRIAFILLQVIGVDRFRFSGLIVQWPLYEAGYLHVDALILSTFFSLAAWLMLLVIPFGFEIAFWASAALLFHRADLWREKGGDLAGAMMQYANAGVGGLLGLWGLILGGAAITILYFIWGVATIITVPFLFVIASVHPFVTTMSLQNQQLVPMVTSFLLLLGMVPVFFLAHLWVFNTSLYKIDDVWSSSVKNRR